MVKAANIPLTNDEHSMIFCHHYGISFLPSGKGSAPSNDYNLILTCAIQLAFSFIFTMLACILSFPWAAFCGIAVGLILLFRVLTLFLFVWALVAGKYFKRFYLTSMVFWGWWPCWLFVFSVTATFCGYITGTYLWTTQLGPYYQLKQLQMYRDINPAHVPGVRLQDAGLVDFQNFVGMDRGKGGCFLNRGNTYCIAPIVFDGTPTPEVHYDMQGMPQTGSYDYFAVGKNCCPCPNRDFTCGEWDNPLAYGGIRSMDEESRPYYKLALDNWQASYGKTSKTPLFFEWVQDPEWKWKGMWNRFVSLGWLAVAAAFSFGISIGFILDKVLQLLWQNDIITPRATFAPAPYLEFITMLLLPKMFYRYNQEQAEIAAMPISAEWHGERGPGSAAEDNKLSHQYGSMGGMGAANMMTRGAISSLIAPPGAPMGSVPTGIL